MAHLLQEIPRHAVMNGDMLVKKMAETVRDIILFGFLVARDIPGDITIIKHIILIHYITIASMVVAQVKQKSKSHIEIRKFANIVIMDNYHT